MATLSAAALLGIATATNAATTTYVQDGFEDAEGFSVGSQVDAHPNWTLGVPGGTSDTTSGSAIAEANIVNAGLIQSGSQSLQLATTFDGNLFRPDWTRDLSAANTGTGIAEATVSLGINYNYDNSYSWDQSVWIYVQSHNLANATPRGRVAAVRLNSGAGGWGFGANEFKVGNSGSSVRNADWHDVRLEFDFAAQTVTYYLDDVLEYVDSLPANTLDPVQGLTYVFIQNGIHDHGGSDTNVTYIDNVHYSVTHVPEPASLAVLGMGFMWMLRRRQPAR